MPSPIVRERVEALIGEGAQLVGALPQAEYENEHRPDPINIPPKETRP